MISKRACGASMIVTSVWSLYHSCWTDIVYMMYIIDYWLISSYILLVAAVCSATGFFTIVFYINISRLILHRIWMPNWSMYCNPFELHIHAWCERVTYMAPLWRMLISMSPSTGTVLTRKYLNNDDLSLHTPNRLCWELNSLRAYTIASVVSACA